MNDPKAHYTQLNAEYMRLIDETIASPSRAQENLPKITALASQIATALDEMTKQLAMAPSPSSTLEAERDELLRRLRKIQMDYNGLLQNTDKLETLRRIRSYQDNSWRGSFNAYLIAFLVLALLLVLVVLGMSYRANSAIIPTNPTIRPAFT
jgi:hypothetical protein